jgi:hypothetical protein
VDYLEMAVSVAQPFLHGANTPQYDFDSLAKAGYSELWSNGFLTNIDIFCLSLQVSASLSILGAGNFPQCSI